MRNKIFILIAISLLAALTSCMVGPNFKKPVAKVPDKWSGPTPAPNLTKDELVNWWKTFNDPILTSLIERAIDLNLDLKIAKSRIRQARAQKKIAFSNIGPSVDATTSFQRTWSREKVPTSSGKTKTEKVTTDQYQAGFDATWELDIFGGTRRGIEAANADVQSSIESYRDTLVTLTAEVASDYIQLRNFQQNIAVASNNLKAQQHSAEITRKRFTAGFANRLDLSRAESQATTTAAQIPVLQASAQQTIYTIGVLLGEEPEVLIEELSPIADIPSAASIPAGIPSELLRRRPDIRKAESDIHGATARIGVATADLYPKFTLLGSAGYASNKLHDWFDSTSYIRSVSPSASWNIFNMGRTRANIEVQKALEEQTLLTYKKTVLTALQDVENALIAASKEEERRQLLIQAIELNRKSVELSLKLYTEGIGDFLSVLDAQQALFISEESLVQSNGNISTDLIALYKALGGGWDYNAQTADKTQP